jgi:hypothetical protein
MTVYCCLVGTLVKSDLIMRSVQNPCQAFSLALLIIEQFTRFCRYLRAKRGIDLGSGSM